MEMLRSHYGDDFITEISTYFLNDIEPLIDQLEVHLRCGNFSQVQFLGHKMKSSGLNLGQDAFSKQCEFFENINPDEASILALTHLELLRKEYLKSVSEIRNYLSKL